MSRVLVVKNAWNRDDWTFTDLYETRQDRQSLIYPLNPKGESWGDGVATFRGNRRMGRMADIDLAAARAIFAFPTSLTPWPFCLCFQTAP
jgi:hypothetical protein